jgi:ABC-2 type transport system permease protein
MQAIYVLWLRQIKRYLRSRTQTIGSLGQPLLFLVALGFGFGPIFKKAGGGNYIDFLTPGIIAQGILFTAVFSGIQMIWDRQFGFLKETLVAPVARFNIMLGRTLGGATISTFQGIIILLLSLIIGFRPVNLIGITISFLVMILIALLFTALGTAIASTMEDFHGFQLIMNFLIMPLFFLSGALFPLNDLPATINFLARLNPLTYGVDGLRAALINSSRFGLGIDLIVLIAITLVVLFIGSYLFSQLEV